MNDPVSPVVPLTPRDGEGISARAVANAPQTPLTPREVDAVLAERLFGWTAIHVRFTAGYPVNGERATALMGRRPGPLPRLGLIPAFSSSYEGMGVVLEAMENLGWTFYIDNEGWRSCQFLREVDGFAFWSEGDDGDDIPLPRAVATAALAALEAVSEEVEKQ